MPAVKAAQLKVVAGALALARQLGKLPASKMHLDYDDGGDVLYISVQRPQKATDTVDLDDEGVLLHYRGKELVGITVLEASKR